MGNSVFGKNPTGERLERIKQSPNYKNGQFQNLSPTPPFAENTGMGGIIYEKIFKKFPDLKPDHPIPSIKTDLRQLNENKDELVWFGHSSYYLQAGGLRFLIDPVFSRNASPVFHSLMAFPGANIYTAADLPEIDYLLITHDHYDHLDRQTVKALKSKVKHVVCGLGVGSHLEYWGYDPKIITEKDWHESIEINKDVHLFVEPARHFSGRGFVRNKTLWVSYVLQTPSLNIYLGGDSGYHTHYSEIGNKYGPFDLAILENGQYNKSWPYIHEMPEETLKAAVDLHAKRILPVHNSKFALANHPWYEPLTKLTELNEHVNVKLITPKIGEVVDLNNQEQKFERWWEDGMR